MARFRAGRPRNMGSNTGRGYVLLASPKRPPCLWDPPSLLFKRYRVWRGGGGGGGLFPRTEAAEGANLTTPIWSLTSVPPHALVVLHFIMHRDIIAIYLRSITFCGLSPVSFRIKFQIG